MRDHDPDDHAGVGGASGHLEEPTHAPVGDPERIAEGWERRFVADEQRAAEAVELYSRLGYEVCADPVSPEEMGEACEGCQLLAVLRFKTIYTRRRRAV